MAQERTQQSGKSGRASQPIRDVMTRNPETVTEKDTISEVARIMRDRDTGVVPVVEGKKVIGLVTDRDIVVRLVAERKDCGVATVKEVMTRSVRAVKEDTSVNEVMNIMASAKIRRVPVVNTNDEIVGIVSIGDLAMETDQDLKVGQTIEDISEGKPNN
jgi:CBS domain-containing protein